MGDREKEGTSAGWCSAIGVDPEVMGGEPVFAGTRVPLRVLFDTLRSGMPLSEFLIGFPGVSPN